MDVQQECDLYNRLGSKSEIRLLPECSLSITYGSGFRVFHQQHDELISGYQSGNTIARSVLGGPVYLHLYHGRDTADEDMPDWGFDGPKILAHLVVINTEEKLPDHAPANTMAKASCIQLFKQDGTVEDVPYVGDLLFYEGKYYGDFSVACITLLSEEEQKNVR